MHETRTILAIDLTSYREAIAAALAEMRPDVEIYQVGEEELDREVRRLLPDVVICSRLTELVKSRIPVWVELYPDCASQSTVCVRGTRMEFDDMQLSDIVSVIDQADRLAHLS